MNYTDLLERMNQSYLQNAGFVPHEASAEGIKLRVLAGELYELSNTLNWVKNQAFVESASDEYVKLHAKDRGIYQKEAVQSVGVLAFSRSEAAPYSVDIPIGTICAVAGEADAQFITTEAGQITTGSTKGYVHARSINGGKRYNAAPNTINTLIGAPEGVSAVRNEEAFVGGADQESMDSYKKRVVSAMSEIPNGINQAYYKRLAESFEGIHMANAVTSVEDPTVITIYIWGKDSEPSSQVVGDLVLAVNEHRQLNTTILVETATQKPVNLSVGVQVKAGYETGAVQAHCEELMREFVSSIRMGETLYISKLTKYLLENANIYNTKVSPYLVDVYPLVGEVFVPGNIATVLVT